MIVDVAHPASVRYIPKRSSRVRVEKIRLVTPCEIPELDPADFPKIVTFRFDEQRGTGAGLDCHGADGKLWIEARRHLSRYGSATMVPRDAGDDVATQLSGFIAGAYGEPRYDIAIAGTPLVAQAERFPWTPGEPSFFMPEALDLTSAAKQVVEFNEEAQRHALQAWVSQNVKIVSGRAWLSIPDPYIGLQKWRNGYAVRARVFRAETNSSILRTARIDNASRALAWAREAVELNDRGDTFELHADPSPYLSSDPAAVLLGGVARLVLEQTSEMLSEGDDRVFDAYMALKRIAPSLPDTITPEQAVQTAEAIRGLLDVLREDFRQVGFFMWLERSIRPVMDWFSLEHEEALRGQLGHELSSCM